LLLSTALPILIAITILALPCGPSWAVDPPAPDLREPAAAHDVMQQLSGLMEKCPGLRKIQNKNEEFTRGIFNSVEGSLKNRKVASTVSNLPHGVGTVAGLGLKAHDVVKMSQDIRILKRYLEHAEATGNFRAQLYVGAILGKYRETRTNVAFGAVLSSIVDTLGEVQKYTGDPLSIQELTKNEGEKESEAISSASKVAINKIGAEVTNLARGAIFTDKNAKDFSVGSRDLKADEIGYVRRGVAWLKSGAYSLVGSEEKASSIQLKKRHFSWQEVVKSGSLQEWLSPAVNDQELQTEEGKIRVTFRRSLGALDHQDLSREIDGKEKKYSFWGKTKKEKILNPELARTPFDKQMKNISKMKPGPQRDVFLEQAVPINEMTELNYLQFTNRRDRDRQTDQDYAETFLDWWHDPFGAKEELELLDLEVEVRRSFENRSVDYDEFMYVLDHPEIKQKILDKNPRSEALSNLDRCVWEWYDKEVPVDRVFDQQDLKRRMAELPSSEPDQFTKDYERARRLFANRKSPPIEQGSAQEVSQPKVSDQPAVPIELTPEEKTAIYDRRMADLPSLEPDQSTKDYECARRLFANRKSRPKEQEPAQEVTQPKVNDEPAIPLEITREEKTAPPVRDLDRRESDRDEVREASEHHEKMERLLNAPGTKAPTKPLKAAESEHKLKPPPKKLVIE
jgi:hypothetical protein